MIDLQLTDEVRTALADGAPVVALESTIISHGMPYPDNVEMAREVEESSAPRRRPRRRSPSSTACRASASTTTASSSSRHGPASDPQGQHPRPALRRRPQGARRDHGRGDDAARGAGRHPGLHHRRLGGVHRGAATTMDVSADLTELSLTDVTVISAGVKSILDIGLTLEKLETLGVPVLGYRTDEFPAFYTRTSGYAVPLRVDSPDEVAALMRAKDGSASPAGSASPTRSRPRTRSRTRRSTRSSSRRSATSTAAASRARTPRRTCSAGSWRSPAARR